MNFEELEHVFRAVTELTGEKEFIAIGSQSLFFGVLAFGWKSTVVSLSNSRRITCSDFLGSPYSTSWSG